MKGKNYYLLLRLFAVMIFCCLITTSVKAQSVNLNFKQTTIKEILKEVTSQTEYTFVYSNSLDAVKNKIDFTYSSSKIDIKDLLSKLFTKDEITCKIDGKQVVLAPKTDVGNDLGQHSSAGVKRSIITGKITDETGDPIPGATVKNEVTGKYASTDINGLYSIEAAQGDKLSFLSLGMITEEVVVGKGSVLDVKMYIAQIALENSIVTGYQTLSKERSAGSFAVVNGATISEKSKFSGSILNSLEGMTTGLNVSQSAGTDQFLIRGLTSINSTRSPLFVVDGVPLDASLVEDMINGNDIESATVLKDATAASIWGSQAANGVVVLTTKKGNRNERLKVTYDASFTYSGKPDYSYQNKMNGATFMKNAQEMFDMYSETWDYDYVRNYTGGFYNTQNTPVVLPHEEAMYQYKEGLISSDKKTSILNQLINKNERQSYEDNFMSNKWGMRHFLSLTGGSDKLTYYLSVGYYKNQDSYQQTSDRISIDANQNFQLTKWLKWDLTINTSLGKVKSKLSPWITDSNWVKMYSNRTYYRDLPYVEYTNADGSSADLYNLYMTDATRDYVEGVTNVDMSFSPVDDYNRSFNREKTTNVRINTGLTIDLLPGLKYEGRFQYSRAISKNEMYMPAENWLVREEYLTAYTEETGASLMPSQGGHFELVNNDTYDWTLRNQLIYDNNFDDGKHQLTALVGTEVRKYLSSGADTYVKGYDYQTMLHTKYDMYALGAAVMDAIFGGSYNTFYSNYYTQTEADLRYFSLYANGAYTYNHKYSLNASIRMDQSNLFGSDPATQYKPIWSVGASWNISKENFMQNVNAINDLSLRASYGFAGNSPEPNQGGAYDILSATSSSWFETLGYDVSTPANKSLTWEKTRMLNAGFDIRFLNNNLNVSLDYYNKYTKNLLGVLNLNPFSGWASTFGNLGEMKNSGIEISINSRNINHRDFKWTTNFTFSNNKNKITRLDVEAPYTYSSILYAQYVEGYAAGSLFCYRYAGLNSNGEPQVYNKKGEIVSGEDANTLTVDDMVCKGSYIPKFYGGLTNTFSYKNWELSFMFVYNLGHKMRKDVTTRYFGRPDGNLYNDFDQRWRKSGDELTTDIPAYTGATNPATVMNSYYYYADSNILDASYIKLRELKVSYNVPVNVCEKLSISSAKLTAQVGNLFYLAANNDGIDPEAKYFASNMYSSRPDKYGANYSFGLTVTF